MKNNLKLVALLCAVLLLLMCACSSVTGTKATDERIWSDAQRLYRDASLVVMGSCVRTHLNEEGIACYDLEVNDVLAGSASKGDLIHCTDGVMKESETYLLYLASDDADVYYSENTANYTLLTDEPLPVTADGEVLFSGAKLSLREIRANISEQSSIVAAPSDLFYYKDLAALVNASSQIFIGRVADIPALTGTRFRADSASSTIENTLPASVIQVEAYGTLKGSLRYGEVIQVIYCPALCDEITDAATLKSLAYTAINATVPQEDGIYLFFLVHSPDAKQSYYFGVNPIQGLVELDSSDRVHVTYLNSALSGHYSLDALVRDIRSIVEN